MNFLPAGQFKHKGHGEWSGPCPRCGGEDRFVVWPEHSSGAAGGKFLCQGCTPEGGDGIQFLRDFLDMRFQDACQELGAETRQTYRPQTCTALPAWQPKEERAPGSAWQHRASAFLTQCAAHIESGPGLAYLQGRGLTLETARRYRIGWNPEDTYEAPEAWGLEPWLNSKGNPGKVFLPAGLVLPTLRKDGIVAVKIRRRDWSPEDKWPKYHALKGGGDGCLVLGKPGQPVVLVEGEIDALLIVQEAGALCSAVALGSAAKRPDAKTAAFILRAPAILYALDFDQGGIKPFAWWKEHFPKMRPWPPAEGKDIGDMLSAGISLALWVRAGLPENPEPPHQPKEARIERLFLTCPRHEKRVACWDCARCGHVDACTAWHHLKAHVAIYRAMEETEMEPVELNGPLPDYERFCSGYWDGCFECPEFIVGAVRFCGRYNRQQGEASEVLL